MRPLQLVTHYARRYKLQLAIVVISMLLLVGAQLLIPWVIRTLISMVTGPGTSAETLPAIAWLSILGFGLFVLRGFLQFVQNYQAHIAGWGVVADVRRHLYDHLQRLKLRFYEDKQTGQLMSQLVNDTNLFEELIAHTVPDVIVNVLMFVGVSAVLMSLNWKLTLLSMIPIPLIIGSLRAYSRYVRPAFRKRQVELGDLNAILNDNISGIREIKAFTREEAELERVSTGIDRYRRSLLHALKLMSIFSPFIEFASSLGTLIIIYFGGRLVFNQVLPVADLVAFFLYLELFYQPVRRIGTAWEQYQSSLAAADRVAGLLSEQPELDESPDSIKLHRAAGHIRFEDVNFHYIEGETVLDDINLDVPAHSVVALVGPTGVGKSTLVSLIPRFYDVIGGKISLDGTDIRQVSLESLRQQISIVLQDVFLFHGTVRDNILFGKPGATEEEMIAAATIANAHDFILDLPDGYDTMIGERGIKLSGGQKQRLSIARAVLKDAPILILDEATSSVDTETELLIQQALERLIKGRTTIIIAHRLSTVRSADQIVVLEGKHIVEKGAHEELIAQDGLYNRLYSIQKQLQPVDPDRLAKMN